jgi:hypothetical protein
MKKIKSKLPQKAFQNQSNFRQKISKFSYDPNQATPGSNLPIKPTYLFSASKKIPKTQ